MIADLFKSPKIVGVVGNVNTGKSNLIAHIILSLRKSFDFKLYTYGISGNFGQVKINSVEELEQIRNSFIIVDEFNNLIDLEDRKKRKLVERTMRLIYHNNNILILIGVPENFKKFICGKLEMVFFNKCNISDFINGSKIKEICLSYKGSELGSSVLNLPQNQTLLFNGLHYYLLNVPYYQEFDTKKKNVDICVPKIVSQNGEKKNKEGEK